ncbi:MAG: winged helix-turn-helix domain-containing protein [Defluviimonas sp.]|nr:winged helix-turn-helix domain-containing protein [Defluviimonas sp.]
MTLAAMGDLSAIRAQAALARRFDCCLARTEAQAGLLVAETRPDLLLIAAGTASDDLGATIARLRAVSRTRYLPVAVWGEESAWLASSLAADGTVDEVVPDLSRGEVATSALRALLRRVRPEALTDQLAFDRLVINELERRVAWDGQTIHPSPTGYRFLAGLVDEPSHMLKRPQILRRVWGNAPDRSRQIDQVVKSLRLLLRPLQAEHLIETVRGAGYRLHALSKE